MSIKVVASKYTMSQSRGECLISLGDFFVYYIGFQKAAGKPSINYYVALHMGKVPHLGHQKLKVGSESPNLGRQFHTQLLMFQTFLMQEIVTLSHRPRPDQLPRQHKCQDTVFTWTTPASGELALMRGQGGLWFSSGISLPLHFLAQPLLPQGLCLSHCCPGALPEAGWHCVREPLSLWLYRVVSLFIVVCSGGSVAREKEKEPLLSIPGGSGLGLGPANVSFCPLLNKAILVCVYTYSISQVFVTMRVAWIICK